MRLLPMKDSPDGLTAGTDAEGTGAVRLSYAEGLVSPCADCADTPCCAYLPLRSFKVTTLLELDHAVYLLNFDRIELGLSKAGDWSIYYRYPCRFLDLDDRRCTVHNLPQQPNICVTYNPYRCWYKPNMTGNVGEEFLRINRRRMAYILDHVVVDEERHVVEMPAWESLAQVFATLPPRSNEQFDPPPTEDPAFRAWADLIRQPEDDGENPAPTYAYADDAVREPCLGCHAACCQTLVFPQSAPTSAVNLDFFRFCLGFPGVELGISETTWSIVVKTTCRHLVDHRCAIYGLPQRPLHCRYYDAWKCTFKTQFGLPRPPGFLRLRLEQFDWLAECYRFDGAGTIVTAPSIDEVRAHVEARWRATSAAPVAVAEAI
jgi:hypothetical protein